MSDDHRRFEEDNLDQSGGSMADIPPAKRTTHDVHDEVAEAMRLYNISKTGAVGDSTLGEPVPSGEAVLIVHVQSADAPIQITVREESVIGRRDPTNSSAPDLDLTPYGGYQMGISRRHAVIRVRSNRLEVVDLGSRNGTYLNGFALKPHQPMGLRSGDELRLGKITIRFYLK
jgi:pSer/pThr/pTyr-binding forkhead associated (FHA) protein